MESSRIGWPQVGHIDGSMGISRSFAGHLEPCHRGLDVRSTSTLKNSNSGSVDTTPNSRQRKNYLQTLKRREPPAQQVFPLELTVERPEHPPYLPACRDVCEQDPEGSEARRPPRGGAHHVRARHQPQDRQGARPDDLAVPPPAGGSVDRVGRLLKLRGRSLPFRGSGRSRMCIGSGQARDGLGTGVRG